MKTLTTAGLILLSTIAANSAHANLEIFTCEPEWASLATELGGDRVTVFSATTGKQDPHHIEARPSLIAKIRRADLIICTGAELESGWLPVLLSKSGNEKIQVGRPGYFMAADYVELLEKPSTVDRSQGDVHAGGNPHIHTSPHNIASVANALSRRLMELDNTNQSAYSAAHTSFNQRWKAAIVRWEKQAEVIKHQSFAVDHKNWVYLANWLNVDMSTTLEPKLGIPPGTEYLAELIKAVDQKNIRKVIHAAYSNPRAARWLAERSNIKSIELPYTVGGNGQVNNLFDLFDETIRLLVN
ncbi:MAG: zinc ABC transporter substrate-binding protein [Gammaproteobacteria bacterium]|nr:zinc ABC transporter substrate-binding protein [Gammaproteobacteria bacterium]